MSTSINHPESARLIELISAVPGVDVEMLEEGRADRLLDRSARLLVTVIHEGYGGEVARGGSSPLLEFRQRGSGGDEGSIVASIIRGAAAKHAAEEQALRVVTSETARLGLNASEAEIDGAVASAIERQREAPFVSVEVERTGETTAPFNIFFPGILTMMVMFAVTLNAISIVEERLDGRLERLLTTGPGLNGIFGGKFLAGLVRGFMQAFILATLGWAVFRSFGPADYGAMLVVTAVLAAFTSAVGMAIASFARTREQANWSAVILTMVMATIGGSFFEPAKGGILDAIGRASPLRYGNDALRIDPFGHGAWAMCGLKSRSSVVWPSCCWSFPGSCFRRSKDGTADVLAATGRPHFFQGHHAVAARCLGVRPDAGIPDGVRDGVLLFSHAGVRGGCPGFGTADSYDHNSGNVGYGP